MARKKHIINVHTSTGTTAPTGASLYLGEIAVQHTANEPALWIKVGATEASTDYEKFIGETEITNIFNQSKILGSGYTYSGLSYVTSATSITDAYSALTKVVIDDEKVVAESINDLNDRLLLLEAVSGASEGLDALSASVVTNKTNVTNLSGSVVTNETDIQILSGMIEECKILGPEYTSSAISYVNSATTIAAAYSALTNEILLDEEAISAAFNDLNDRITPIEGLSGVTLDLAALSASVVENKTSITSLSASVVENKTDISEIDRITSEAINDLNSRLLPLEGLSGASDDISALSAAVVFNYNYIDEVEYVAGQSLNELNNRVSELCGNTAGVLTLALNGVSQGQYSPSANTTIDMTVVTHVTGADVLLSGYTISSGQTQQELEVVSADTVNEAIGKLQKQAYDNELIMAGAFNDVNDRIRALEANSGTSEALDELSGAVVSKDYVIATALNDLNTRLIGVESGLTTELSSGSTDSEWPSAKATYDEIHPKTESSMPAGGLYPNVYYNLGVLSGTVSITFSTPFDQTVENEYRFRFTASTPAPTITWPSSITKWAGNCLNKTTSKPNITDGNIYEVSVLDGLGIIIVYE